MGLKLDKLKKNPVQFLSLTGFSPEEFDELATEFRIEWDQYSSHFTLEGKLKATYCFATQDQCFTWIPGQTIVLDWCI